MLFWKIGILRVLFKSLPTVIKTLQRLSYFVLKFHQTLQRFINVSYVLKFGALGLLVF